MRKLIYAVAVGAAVLAVLASTAIGATITVEGLEMGGTLNIEMQGRFTFEGMGGFTVVCSKTLRGDLEMRVAGTLTLNGNNAGKLGMPTLSCTGATVRELNTLPNPVRLSWTRVEEQPFGNERYELTASPFEIEVSNANLECLYELLLTLRATGNANHIVRTFELVFTSGFVRTIRGMCPTVLTFNGMLTLTRPAAGIRIRLVA